jgi:hypothetical protein
MSINFFKGTVSLDRVPLKRRDYDEAPFTKDELRRAFTQINATRSQSGMMRNQRRGVNALVAGRG